MGVRPGVRDDISRFAVSGFPPDVSHPEAINPNAMAMDKRGTSDPNIFLICTYLSPGYAGLLFLSPGGGCLQPLRAEKSNFSDNLTKEPNGTLLFGGEYLRPAMEAFLGTI
jgi:hypothetical protein